MNAISALLALFSENLSLNSPQPVIGSFIFFLFYLFFIFIKLVSKQRVAYSQVDGDLRRRCGFIVMFKKLNVKYKYFLWQCDCNQTNRSVAI